MGQTGTQNTSDDHLNSNAANPAADEEDAKAQSSASRPFGTSGGAQNNVALWAVCGFLVVTIGLIYGQTLCYPFDYHDDNFFVYDNPHVKGGLTLDSVAWAFTSGPAGE